LKQKLTALRTSTDQVRDRGILECITCEGIVVGGCITRMLVSHACK
jgi:hypothetical protein